MEQAGLCLRARSSNATDSLCETVLRLSCGSGRAGGAFPKGRHNALGEELLSLDRFPVLEAAEIRDDRKFADAALLLEILNLANHLFRRADEPDFLIDNFVVGKFGERFEGAAGIETVALGAQLGFLGFVLQRIDG